MPTRTNEHGNAPFRQTDGAKNLSGRERQIVGLAAAGLLDKQIGAELGISLNTLRTYWARIRQKSGNMPRTALAVAFVKSEMGSVPASPHLPASIAQITDFEELRRAAIYYATALERVEAKLAMVDRAQRVLSTYLGIGDGSITDAELANHVCRILVEEGGYVMAWIGLAQADHDKSVKLLGSFGDNDGYLEGLRISWGDNPLGQGPTGKAIRSGKTQINQDFHANPAVAPWRERAIARGYESSIGIPLMHGSRKLGVLTVYAEEPDAFHECETSTLEAVALGLAMRLFEK